MMLKRAFGVVLTFVVAACGGSSSATAPTPQTPTPPPPVTRTITAGTYSATAHFSHFISFITPATGQVSITVSWGNASDTLWVDLSASCTSDQAVAGTCQFIYSDRSSGPVAQKTAVVKALAAGTYVLIIDNRGPSDENVSFEIDLTS
jgi:hypothetical protein